MSYDELIALALDRAQRGVGHLSHVDRDGKFADEDLYQAWDQLQSAAKCVEEARLVRKRSD